MTFRLNDTAWVPLPNNTIRPFMRVQGLTGQGHPGAGIALDDFVGRCSTCGKVAFVRGRALFYVTGLGEPHGYSAIDCDEGCKASLRPLPLDQQSIVIHGYTDVWLTTGSDRLVMEWIEQWCRGAR